MRNGCILGRRSYRCLEPPGSSARLCGFPTEKKNNEENPEERPVLLGSRVSVFHPDHGKTETLYRAVKGSWIVGQPAWDPAGRYLAFPTGKQQDGEIFFEEVHVTDGKIFHYVESEQNLLSTRLKHLTLSPGGDYLCYAINGILKLVDLRTLESRVYDVYNQVQSDSEYVRFDPGGVWLAQNHEILFVKDNMEEREVYRTRQKVLGFHLSGKRDKLLVREESAKGQVLKLIDLRICRTPGNETAENGAGRAFHGWKGSSIDPSP